MKRAALILWCGVFVFGCVGGSRAYRSGTVQHPLAVFVAPGCKLDTDSGQMGDRTTFYMVQGRSSYSLLVLDGSNKGREIENYWLDEKGHNFATYNVDRDARVYSIPDREGANGTLSYFRPRSYKTQHSGKATEISGNATNTCELTYVPPQSQAPAEVTSATCTPGVTQECVGAGACKGGQRCREDGSGFSDCDCGTSPPPPSENSQVPQVAAPAADDTADNSVQ